MHKNSLNIMQGFVSTCLASKIDQDLHILDVGSRVIRGQRKFGSYKQFFNDPKWVYMGVDITEGDNVDLVMEDSDRLPFYDNSFDVIISGQTLEHVEYPWEFMKEIARVLKVGGICCIIAPARIHEHRYPIDTFRYYPDGMLSLAKWSGLKVIKAKRIAASHGLEDTYLIAEK